MSKYAIAIDCHGNEVEIETRIRRRPPIYHSEDEESDYSDYSDESDESEYECDEDDFEIIHANNVVHTRRVRKKTRFYKNETFLNGRDDPYERSSGKERNNWFGKKGETTRLGKKEDDEYVTAKRYENGYELNDFVV